MRVLKNYNIRIKNNRVINITPGPGLVKVRKLKKKLEEWGGKNKKIGGGVNVHT